MIQKIKEWGWSEHLAGTPLPTEPFWNTVIMYDIPKTIISAIRSMPDNCVGVTLGTHAKHDDMIAIIKAAKKRRIGIKWVECERTMLDALLET